ncbi:MAG: hypothetical protein D6771_07200 [Zetaproteobacteria bacterium]|nr:MAG: hypothetical protein D6771_07200 [Zetaproteobacteria bacterium]
MSERPWKPNPFSRFAFTFKAFLRTWRAQLLTGLAVLAVSADLGLAAFLAQTSSNGIGVEAAVGLGALYFLGLMWTAAFAIASLFPALRGENAPLSSTIMRASRATPLFALYALFGFVFIAACIGILAAASLLLAKVHPALMAVGVFVGALVIMLITARLWMASVNIVAEGASPWRAIKRAWRAFGWWAAARFWGNLLFQQIVFMVVISAIASLTAGSLVATLFGALQQNAAAQGAGLALGIVSALGWLLLIAAIVGGFMGFAMLATAAMFHEECIGAYRPEIEPPSKTSWVASGAVALGFGLLFALPGVQSPHAPSAPALPSAPSPAPSQAVRTPKPENRRAPAPSGDAAAHRRAAWQAWLAGDDIRVIREADKALSASFDSAIRPGDEAQKRKAKAWTYAIRAWAYHRMGDERNARASLTSACAWGHAPSCAVLESLR